ncbi:MAG: ADP-ribosylglycohydrolase family protein [Candidatus Riflebacteria bacterium]|nr:ADP-ribosylglycohydrolase family protein [Candidatus Riflebacteria bacterium]
MIEKFQASMLGFAIGDALAAPIEDVIREQNIDGEISVTDYLQAMPSHPIGHLSPGQYSDETQTMLLVAESVVARKGFHIDDLVQRFIDWYQTQKYRSSWRFPGNTMIKACRKLAAGTHWSQSGFPSAGIGGSIRTLPLALAFHRQPGVLKGSIEQSCKITHTDPRVSGAAIVLATTIRIGLEGADAAPDAIINPAIERAQVFAPDLPRRLKVVRDTLRLDTSIAIEQIGNTGFALDAVCCALYLFLKFPRSFDKLVSTAAVQGGDSDAIAAMAGAMFGAFNGLAAIPDRWLAKLENVDHIKQLGCDLYRLAVPQR